MQKFLRSISVKIQYIIWALSKTERPHLGEEVSYMGKRCVLVQGVANPYWDLVVLNHHLIASDESRKVYKRIHISHVRRDPLRKRFWKNFKADYNFQMGNWYSIDMKKKGKISYR